MGSLSWEREGPAQEITETYLRRALGFVFVAGLAGRAGIDRVAFRKGGAFVLRSCLAIVLLLSYFMSEMSLFRLAGT